MRSVLLRVVFVALGLSAIVGCNRKTRLHISITGISAIVPGAEGALRERTIVLPDARMPRWGDRLNPDIQSLAKLGLVPSDDIGSISPHFAHLRVPLEYVDLSRSRQPDLIFESNRADLAGYDAEEIKSMSAPDARTAPLVKTPPVVKYGVWLLGLAGPSEITVNGSVEPVILESPTLENVPRMGSICFNPNIAPDATHLPSSRSVAAIINLPAAYMTRGRQSKKNWTFYPPLEHSAGDHPDPGKPLAREVYSEWNYSKPIEFAERVQGAAGSALPAATPTPNALPLLSLKATGGVANILIGDAPLEDILLLGHDDQASDTHFELYYLLTDFIPIYMGGVIVPLPHFSPLHIPVRSSSIGPTYVPWGHNCPPLTFEARSASVTVPEEVRQQYEARVPEKVRQQYLARVTPSPAPGK